MKIIFSSYYSIGVQDVLVTRIVDCVSDDQLKEVTFGVFLKQVAFLSAGSNSSDPVVEQQVKYAAQLLWELFKKSSHALRQRLSLYIADEPHLVASILKTMCTCLELFSKY